MNTPSDTTYGRNTFRTHAINTIGLLVIQFILGMLTNLFVHFPDTTHLEELWAFARSQILVDAHIVVAILLLGSAIAFVIRAARAKYHNWIVSSAAGLIGIIIAFMGGVTFTSTQNDIYSLVMALGFMTAFIAYGWGLYADKK